jgi:hypothetical protein
MNKSQEIQSIIGQRQPLAKKLTDIETGLSSLYASLQRLEQERDRQLLHWSGDEATKSKLQTLDFASFEENIREHLTSLGRLQGRFSRKTPKYWGNWSDGTRQKHPVAEFEWTKK